ncbi:MAG TPA: hypothetical protein PLF25_10640 [Accumulibacter sp.]|nr:hypothetical protein [Accumulibacter sp.]
MTIGASDQTPFKEFSQTDSQQGLAVAEQHAFAQVQSKWSECQTQIDDGRTEFVLVAKAFPQ